MTKEEVKELIDNLADVLATTKEAFPTEFATQLKEIIGKVDENELEIIAAFFKLSVDELKAKITAGQSILNLLINTFGTDKADHLANFLRKMENRRILIALLARMID